MRHLFRGPNQIALTMRQCITTDQEGEGSKNWIMFKDLFFTLCLLLCLFFIYQTANLVAAFCLLSITHGPSMWLLTFFLLRYT